MRPDVRAGLLAAGVVALGLVDIGTRTFATNDEARFPVLGQSLLSGGHWLVPSLNGIAYVNKPPLLAWAIAAVSWPAGHVTQLTAVMPSVVAGLVTVLMVYRLGRELWNTTTGRYAAAIAATTQGLFVHARLAMPDMMLTAFAAIAFWALQRMRRRRGSLEWLVFYAAVAGGFWTKGAAGLMPLGIAVGYALMRRGVEPMGWLRLGPGLGVFGLLLAPWTLFASVRDGDAVHQTVFLDYVRWYLPQRLSIVTILTPLQHALSVAFPWTWLAPFALYDAWRLRRGRGAERDAVVLALFWAAAVLAMVSVSHQQRLRYYVPLVPPLSLLLGWWLATAVVQCRRLTLWPLRATAALYGTVAAVAVAWSLAQGRLLADASAMLPTSTWQATLTVIAAGTVVVAMEVGLRGHRLRRALPLAVVGAAVLVASLHHAEEARRNAAHDYTGLARLAHQLRQAGAPVATLGVPVLPVAFYVGERVADLTPEAQARIGRAAFAGDTALVIADERRLGDAGEALTIGARATLGRQRVVIARVRAATADQATAALGAAIRRPATSSPLVSRHIAFELLSLIVALAAVVARGYVVRHGGDRVVISVAETTAILALASFPGHWLVFAGGVAAAAICAYVRWRRPALSPRPHDLVGALLLLALPLDVLEDVLQGTPIAVDPIWIASAIGGFALITARRVYFSFRSSHGAA